MVLSIYRDHDLCSLVSHCSVLSTIDGATAKTTS
jgi:hypothetical protein